MTPVSRRENEVLDAVYKLGEPSVQEVMDALKDGASYSTVRTLLGNLVKKGWLTRKAHGMKYTYAPTVNRSVAARSDLKRLVSTYFEDSPVKAVNSFLDLQKGAISEEELDQLQLLLEKKRKQLKK